MQHILRMLNWSHAALDNEAGFLSKYILRAMKIIQAELPSKHDL